MEVVRFASGEIMGFQPFDLLGLNDKNVFARLKFSCDLEEGFLRDYKTEFLE